LEGPIITGEAFFISLASNHPSCASNNIAAIIRVGFFLPINPPFSDIFIQIKQQFYIQRFDIPMKIVNNFSNRGQHSIILRGTMKNQTRYLISLLVMVTFYLDTSTAQTSLTGFLNIPFGIKMETAKKLLLQKPGVKFIRQSDCDNLYFTGFSMGVYKADTCILMESPLKGRFESSKLVFHSKVELFEEIYELFRAKYGNPTKINSEENNIFFRWEFPVKGSKYKNSITLQNIPAADYFMLSYSGMGMLCPGWLQYYSQKNKK